MVQCGRNGDQACVDVWTGEKRARIAVHARPFEPNRDTVSSLLVNISDRGDRHSWNAPQGRKVQVRGRPAATDDTDPERPDCWRVQRPP